MHHCSKCSSLLYPDDKFCGQCGTAIVNDENNAKKLMTQMELKIEDVRSNLGVVYFKMGRFDEAVSCFEKILKEDPDNLSARTMLEMIKEERTKVDA